MKIDVHTPGVCSVPPEPTITLMLTVQEFAILDLLRHHALNGESPLRDTIELSFGLVTSRLDPYWRSRVLGARDIQGHITDRVRKAFSV